MTHLWQSPHLPLLIDLRRAEERLANLIADESSGSITIGLAAEDVAKARVALRKAERDEQAAARRRPSRSSGG